MSHQVPRQNYQLGEKVAPWAGSLAYSWESEAVSRRQLVLRASLQKWEETKEEEKIISKEKKCTLSQATHSSCDTGPFA